MLPARDKEHVEAPERLRPLELRVRAEPVYLNGTRGPLFGWWHEPADNVRRAAAVVLVSPLAHEYMYTHRSVRQLAAQLAASGFSVLRYDHYGTGDSPGDDAASGLVQTWREDIGAAVAAARARAGVALVAVVGLRVGATLALAAAESSEVADSLVLWCATSTGKAFAREMRALSLANAVLHGEQVHHGADPGSIAFSGFTLSAETVSGLGGLRPMVLAHRPAKQVLIVERDDFRPDDALATHLEALGSRTHRQQVPGYPAMMSDPLTSQVPVEMLDIITGWLADAYPLATTAADADDLHAFAHSMLLGEDSTAVRETPVVFGPDRRLFGILTAPALDGPGPGSMNRTCVLLLNTGGDHHVGPSRLYVRFAREWGALGFASLRLDLRGLGDAASLDCSARVDAYPVDALADIRTTLSRLFVEYGVERVVLMGLCSGAYHAIKAAQLGLPVTGIVAVNPQLYYERDSEPPESTPNSEQQRVHRALFEGGRLSGRERYRRRLRFAKRGLVSSLSLRLTALMNFADTLLRRALGRETIAPVTLFNRACETLVVFSQGDPGLYFLETRAPLQLARLRAEGAFRVEIVAGADHTFTYRGVQDELNRLLTDFLRTRSS